MNENSGNSGVKTDQMEQNSRVRNFKKSVFSLRGSGDVRRHYKFGMESAHGFDLC